MRDDACLAGMFGVDDYVVVVRVLVVFLSISRLVKFIFVMMTFLAVLVVASREKK